MHLKETTSLPGRAEIRHAQRSVATGDLLRDAVEPVLRRLDQWCLTRLGRAFAGAPMRLQLWNGLGVSMSDGPIVGTLVVRDRATLRRLVIDPPELAFGEGFTAGRIEVQGDLPRLLEAINRALADRWPAPPARRQAAAAPASARHNVHLHYDLGNAFYRLWLDDAMVYTCAYFERPDASLEEAQRAKLDHVCRKLRLQPGDRVVEAGCGWGALALHMAKYYGASVRAFNISEPQLEFARARARAQGLDRQIEFIDADYRAIDGACDAFVSIGMVEHVGAEAYPELGRVMNRVLDRDRGRGLLHFIGRNVPMPFNQWTTKYIFPGAYGPSLCEILPSAIDAFGFSVLDVENLRLHYAKTLEHWRQRFEDHVDSVREMFGETFIRTWRLYLASAQAGFASGDLQLFQVSFARARDNAIPWTRRALSEAVPERRHAAV